MAELDEDDVREDVMADDREHRPCAFCGAAIHPSSHRCPECSGHVGLAWGTVHKEQFLFLLAAVFMLVGCLASWDQVRPSAFNGLQTIRGTIVAALCTYGILSGLIAVFHRRTLVWPFLLAALDALWVGIEGFTSALNSDLFKRMSEETGVPWWNEYRAIPPGFWLLIMGGALVVMAILKGLVGGFAGAKSKARDAADAKAAKEAERRSRRATVREGGMPPADPRDLPPTDLGASPPPPV